MHFIYTLIYFLICLDLIVIVHELGHLITAKKYGVFCYEFAIGMGPKLFTFYKDKTGTIYTVRLIPIGGFVQMAGEEESVDNKNTETITKLTDDQLITNKKPFQRLVIFSAGVFLNFVLALILLMPIGIFKGFNEIEDYVKVIDNSELSTQIDYEYVYVNEINGQEMKSLNQTFFTLDKIKSENENSSYELDLVVQDKETSEEKEVTLNMDSDSSNIELVTTYSKGFGAGLNRFTSTFSDVFDTLRMLFTGVASISDLSGPVGIFNLAGDTLENQDSFSNVIVSAMLFTSFLSINVGIVNLLPIPALDGGRIIFTLIEIIRKKPLPKKVEDTSILITFFLLMALMLFTVFNDILRVTEGVL